MTEDNHSAAAPHGGNLADVARRYGVDAESLADFSASINPLGQPAAVGRILREAADSLLHYPDPDCTELARALAEARGCAPSQVIVGNGSNELIYLLCRVLDPRRAVIAEPTFSEYAAALGQTGCGIERVFAAPGDSFRRPLEALERAARDADVAFVCNPNNPTGALAAAEDLLDVAAQAPDCTFVVDEAFIDFAPEAPSCAGQGQVLTLRSMTKFYAVPGLRLGYAVGPEGLMQRLRAAREPWSVNTLAQEVGLAVLEDSEFAARTHELVAEERAFLLEGLAANALLEPFPTSVNFVLVRIKDPGIACDALRDALIPKGVVIRHCSNFPGLGGRYFRVAVRTRPENERLLSSLSEAVSGRG